MTLRSSFIPCYGQKISVGATVKLETFKISSQIFKDEDGSWNSPSRKEIHQIEAPAAFFKQQHGEIQNTNCSLQKLEKVTTG